MSLPVEKSKIESIAVIGAGQRGRAIARAALFAGYRTILEDVSPQVLDDAVGWLKSVLSRDAQHPAGQEGIRGCGLENLTIAASLEDALREADLAIEAAAEEMEAKIELFTIFDKFAKAGAILASASPALSIAEMASVTFCPERCVGMRFGDSQEFTSIELVTTPGTSEETVATCRAVATRMGKEVSVVEEPGDSRSGVPAKSAAAARM